MRKKLMIGAGCGGLLIGIGGIASAAGVDTQVAKQGRSASTGLLRPLTDADQQSTQESGCQLSFNTAHNTLVYAIGHDFMIRTRAGLRVCPITDRQFSALSGGGTRSCGGVRITVRQTGRVIGTPASDSASGRARLTVTGGGRTWSTNGYWGTAC
jgi:hypothetical protein